MADGVDTQQLARTVTRLGDTVLDPTLWPEVLEDISTATGSFGAVLVQPDTAGAADRAVRQALPHTPSMADAIQRYFADGWWEQDARAKGTIRLLARGHKIILEHDLLADDLSPAEGRLTLDERRHNAYLNEYEYRHGLLWSSAIVFDAGASPWVLSLKQSAKQPPFSPGEKKRLESLRLRLGEAATLSSIVGRRVLTGIADVLSLIRQPAVIISRAGIVLASNGAADELFDDDLRISGRRLVMRDEAASRELKRAVERIGAAFDTAPLVLDPIAVRRRPPLRPVIMRLFSVPQSARGLFLGGCTLVLLSDPNRTVRAAPANILSHIFGLTTAEGRLADLLAQGLSIEDAANTLSIARETARTHLRSIFAKTGIHRQSELVALLARL